jgi:Tol biopolymer transport system component
MIDTLASPGTRGRLALPQGVVVAAVCFAAVASGLGPRSLAAQAGRGQAAAAQPQPRFTRIFGSDTMTMWQPALSPDGRWIAFLRQQGRDSLSLWVVPASGGAPTQLLSGPYSDATPAWFPSGDRIAFSSNRPSPPGAEQSYIMTVPFDPATGRSAGPARQVSLEQGRWPVVSPDGRWILFRPARRGTLIVVPSVGGTARTVVQVDGSVSSQEWSPDSREIFFGAGVRRPTGAFSYTLSRVSADSGPAQLLWSTPRMLAALNGTTRRVLSRTIGAPDEPMEVSTFEGRHLSDLPLHRNMIVWSFAPDGRSALATVSDFVAPIRVVPVAGGPARTLTQAREYDAVGGWSPDGTRLGVLTRVNGGNALLDVPITGGQAAEIATLPEVAGAVLSDDRSHLFYVVRDAASGRIDLMVRRLRDGSTREIARDVVYPTPFTSRPGARPLSGREVLYLQRRGGHDELRGCAPEGQPHLLRRFPVANWRDVVSVHGERVAWTEEVGDSSILLVAEGPNGAPQRVAAMPGHLQEPTWSPDGRWIAAGYHPLGEHTPYSVFVIGVTPAGRPSVPSRLVPAGPRSFAGIKWLPDDRAVTVVAQGAAARNDILLISLREGDQPVNLTRDESRNLWDYSLSPDGRYIAYPAEIPRGSSIWRIDLPR